MKIAALVLLLALEALNLSAARPQPDAKRLNLRTLSTRADRVTGGDVLAAVGDHRDGNAAGFPTKCAMNTSNRSDFTE